MKHPAILAAASLLLSLAVPALAADSHADHQHALPMTANQAAADSLTDGTVKKVDQAAGKLTVSHGPLPNGMPAMTMSFRVKDSGWLRQVKDGDHIRFAAESLKGIMTIVQLEPVH